MRRQVIVGRRQYLERHASPRSARRLLRTLQATAFARGVRDAAHARIARDEHRRRELHASAADWRRLVEDRALWDV
jgi:hypothetical protein